MSKIFGHASATPSTAPASAAPAGTAAPTSASSPAAAPGPAQAPVSQPTVDVAAILDGLAAKSPEHLDWKKSIVDLLKLVGMDSSLAARKELAADLHYTGDTTDSASMNIWLHKQVLQKLAENGGKVPQELLK